MIGPEDYDDYDDEWEEPNVPDSPDEVIPTKEYNSTNYSKSCDEQIYDFEVHEKEAYLDYYEYKRNYRESHPEEFVNNHGWFNDRDD